MRLRRLFGGGGDEEPRSEPDEAAEDDEASPDAAVDDEGVEDAGPADAGADDDPDDAGDDLDDLDDDDPDGADDGDDDERGAQIAFELGDWGARERNMLDDQLGAVRIARAWEAGTLVVDRADADVVDDLIDEIDQRVSLDLPPDVEPVTYGVGDWPPGLEDRFIEALIEARVPHQRGYREITVGVDDEEQVDGLVEEISAAWADEQPTDEELDGPDAQQVLSELFVGSDRLQHDPSDRAGTVRFDDAAEDVATMGVPFGFDEADWEQVVTRVAALRDLLAEPSSTDDDITEAARALRSHLRPLV